MRKLKDGLEGEMKRGQWSTTHKPSIATPENGVKVKLRFRKNIVADVLGSTAATMLDGLIKSPAIKEEKELPHSTLLVTEHFTSRVLGSGDLSALTGFRIGTIQQRVTIPFPKELPISITGVNSKSGVSQGKGKEKGKGMVLYEDMLKYLVSQLEEVFDSIKISETPTSGISLVIQELVSLSLGLTNDSVVVQWAAAPLADTVADCAVGIVLQAFSTQQILRHSLALPLISDEKNSNQHQCYKGRKRNLVSSGGP
jgi:hypothetical protein